MTAYSILNSIIFGGVIIVTIALNVVTTKLVLESSIHSVSAKFKMVLLSWILPVIGPLISVSWLKKDTITNREKVDEQMVDSLNELTRKIDSIREQIDQKRKDKTQ